MGGTSFNRYNAALISTIGGLVLTVEHQSHGGKKKVKRDDKRGRKRNYRLTNMEIKKEKKGKKVPLKYSVKPDGVCHSMYHPVEE